MDEITDKIALIDLDGTVADYDGALKAQMHLLQAPNEEPYGDRYVGGREPRYIEARRKLIQRQSGFWRGLHRLEAGFEIVEELRTVGFSLHVLTKGPATTPSAWSEKVEWSKEFLPDAAVTVTSDKSLFYGRVLVDDYPEYFMKWLAVRPRGFVICVAQPWNDGFQVGGGREHPNVYRYEGNIDELIPRVQMAYDRKGRDG